ncbi:hypothetical protein PHLCEN_2v6504 [Hermanssonia centrifuga]|uniref:Uncharacterized protein n=1 Tax=Hermanssonia centrifuga TaxID=98765 RepID=A0A2R6NZA8_9APHY|nr:hypothetical protein PHLCEN_2v6504 [Hermanssonia centrifuga]
MSKAGKSLGTQSPPLEATGEDKPMGISSIDGDTPDAVPDSEQREEYFKDPQPAKDTAPRAQK